MIYLIVQDFISTYVYLCILKIILEEDVDLLMKVSSDVYEPLAFLDKCLIYFNVTHYTACHAMLINVNLDH